MTQLKTIKSEILDISRQNQSGNLSKWFDVRLDALIEDGKFPSLEKLHELNDKLIDDLVSYKNKGDVSTVVLGMSGGVDSAVTAALFKKAGWRVIGVTMPIHQDQSETDRGIVTIEALGLEAKHLDLSDAYDAMVGIECELDSGIYSETTAAKIRRGNIRARLRMITLYNLAAANGGLVASTDNFSELAAGFWTIAGDIGDLSPIQSLMKSWEVPMLAKINGVPEETWKAKPTDGLGVDEGDEAQFGFTYLQMDIILQSCRDYVLKVHNHNDDNFTIEALKSYLNVNNDLEASIIFDKIFNRMKSTWFKRYGTINIQHPFDDNRYNILTQIDNCFYVPNMLK